MVDPMSVAASVGLGALTTIATDELARRMQDRRELGQLLSEVGVDQFDSHTAGVLKDWIQQERVQRLLIAEDFSRARAGLTLLLKGVDAAVADDRLDVLVRSARSALYDRLPEQIVTQLESRKLALGQERLADMIGSVLPTADQVAEDLPALVEAELDKLDVSTAQQLRTFLASTPPPTDSALRGLVADRGILAHRPPEGLFAAAVAAGIYERPSACVDLWKEALAVSAHPALLEPRLALALNTAGDGDAALALAERAAGVADAPPLAAAARARLTEDWEALAALGGLDLDERDDWDAGVFRADALVRLGRLDEAIDLADELSHARRSATAQRLAAALRIQRVTTHRSRDNSADLAHAVDAATDALDLKRRWRLPANPELDVLVHAAHLRDDHEAVRGAVEFVRGHQMEWNLEYPDTARFVAFAHIVAGLDTAELPDQVRRFGEVMRSRLEGEQRIEELLDHLEDLHDLQARLPILLALADLDALPDGELERVEEQDADLAAAVRSVLLVARGDEEAAVREANRASASPGVPAEWLAMIHVQLGHYRQLTRLAEEVWQRRRDAGLLALAFETLADVAGDVEGGATLVDTLRELTTDALLAHEVSGPQRVRLCRARFNASSALGRWDAAAQDARALLECDLSEVQSRQVRWRLAQTLVNNGQTKDAWQVVKEPAGRLLDPEAPFTGPLAAQLALAHSTDARHVHWLIDRVDLQAEGPAAQVLLSAWMLSIKLDDGEAQAKVMPLVREFTDQHPNNTVLRRVDADELLADGGAGLLEHLPPVPPHVLWRHRQVAVGALPPMVLAAATNKPYTIVLVDGTGPHVHAGPASIVVRQRGRDAARRAVEEGCILDLTAIRTLAVIDVGREARDQARLAPLILRALPQARTTPQAALDVTQTIATEPTQAERSYLGPGTEDDPRPVHTELTGEPAQRRLRTLEFMEEITEERLGRVPGIGAAWLLDQDDDEGSTGLAAAMSPSAAGDRADQPVWIDDGATRRMLLPRGVGCFDSYALLDALADVGRLDAEQHAACRAALLQAAVVPARLAVDELLTLLEQTGNSRDGPAAGILLSAAWWVEPRNTNPEAVTRLLQHLVDADATDFHHWLFHMLVGVARQHGADEATGFFVRVLLDFPDLRPHAEDCVRAWQQAIEVVTGVEPSRDHIGRAARRLENRWQGGEWVGQLRARARRLVERMAATQVW